MEKKIENFFDVGDKIIVTIVLFLFISLLLVQLIFTYEPLRWYFNLVENIEGEKILDDFLVQPGIGLEISQGFVEINLATPYIYSLPRAKILINGQNVGDFTKLQNKFFVTEGDEITIDTTQYSLDLRFNIAGSQDIIAPTSINIPANSKTSFSITKGK